jgi:hypothetical protein
MAGVEVEFFLSSSDPDHLRQFLRAHDMALTLADPDARMTRLPDDVWRELSRWIGVAPYRPPQLANVERLWKRFCDDAGLAYTSLLE